MSQVGHLNIHAHLFFIVLVQDIKHYLSGFSYLDGVKVDLFLSELLDLLLNHTTFRITLRVIIIAGAVVVVFGPVAGSISNENGIPAISLPILV